MYYKNILSTLFSKVSILILNFLIVILSTNLWGAGGKGIISIIIADMSIIAIINNVFAGSSVSYLIPKVGYSKLILPAYVWIFISTISCAFLFSTIGNHDHLLTLILITLLNSLVSLNLIVFVAKENIHLYNRYSLLSPLLLILFIAVFEFVLKMHSVNSYAYSLILSQLIVYGLSWLKIKPFLKTNEIELSRDVACRALDYGWKNELSNFVQFLNYRLSFYFVLYYLGLKSVGLFSVGIALAESVWVICRSISTVIYAKMINTEDEKQRVELTVKSARISLVASLAVVAVLLVVPSGLYEYVFGSEFRGIKQLFILLIPGVISMSFSNIHGLFFAASNYMATLITKSLLGLISTIILSVILIPRWGMMGAGVVSSVTYFIPSVYILIVFYRRYARVI
jgi:O-antigen/teichoic acid export membrane protein